WKSTRDGTALLAALVVVVAVYLTVHNPVPPRHTVPEWTPAPYDPPVRWAHRSPFEAGHPEAPPVTDELVVCTEWTLLAEFKAGEGRLDPGFTYGAGCGRYDESDDDCSAQLRLSDAASRVRTSSGELRDMPVAVSRGRRLLRRGLRRCGPAHSADRLRHRAHSDRPGILPRP